MGIRFGRDPAPQPYASVLVPISNVKSALADAKATSNNATFNDAAFNDAVFDDGLVSLDRVTKAKMDAKVSDVVRQLAADHAAKPADEQLRIQLEAREARAASTISDLNSRWDQALWACTPEAPKDISRLRVQLCDALMAESAVSAQLGIDKPHWYAAWSGRIAALEGAVDKLDRLVTDAAQWPKEASRFAADVCALGAEQREMLASGLEACERFGVGFGAGTSTSTGEWSMPGATVLGDILSRKPIIYGVANWACAGKDATHPFLTDARPIESLPQLIAVIEWVTKRDLGALKQPKIA